MNQMYRLPNINIVIILNLLPLILISCNHPQKTVSSNESSKPNIVIIYVDDLGYGDLSCYGATAITTPNVDKLAASGIRFTDAHSSAATCTPSRYSLLTGNYAFRSSAIILPGDAPLLIKPDSNTLPSMLKRNGYTTAVVGKWHLGLGTGQVDWNKEVVPGPREIGFDYSFILPSTGDRVPSVYMENQKVVNLNFSDPLSIKYTDDPSVKNPFNEPTGLSNPELLKIKADTQHSGTIINGVSRIGFMKGGKAAHFKDEDFPKMFLKKSKEFITANKAKPFFLYFSFHDIHVPRVPSPEFAGKSSMGSRGDAILQMDKTTGDLMQILKEAGVVDNTLIIFTSDNGPVLNDGYDDKSVELLGGHKPAGPFKEGKYSAFEGGTRMPTIVYWPARVKSGVSNALWSQVDLYASIGSLLGYNINKNEAPDSENVLNAILGKSAQGRKFLLEESYTYAIRKDNWKYIAPTNQKFPWMKELKGTTGGISSLPQLYNLSEDTNEGNNLASKYPAKLEELKRKLDQIIKP